MAGDVPFFIPAEIQEVMLEEFRKQTMTSTSTVSSNSQWDGFNHREALEAIDKEYYRDNIYTEAKILAGQANRQGDKKKLQDIVLPLAESQTDTMLAHLVSVFLTGSPMFGVTSAPEYIDQAKMYQAILSDQEIYGGWVGEFIPYLFNGLKYFGIMEVDWCKEKVYTPEVTVNGRGEPEPKTIIWQGNRCRNIDPYNFFWDRRAPITQIHTRADYAGYVELETRASLAQFIQSKNISMNVNKIFPDDGKPMEMVPQTKLFYVPDFLWNSIDNLGVIQRGAGGGTDFIDDFSDWEVGPESKKKTFKNAYYKVTRYVRFVPNDFSLNVPLKRQVQIWKFITINDKVMIYAERQNNNHLMIPLIGSQPVIDGLKYNNRSFVQKQLPLQDIASALWNLMLESKRRAVSDRMIFDPSKITKENISSTNATARIPVRPSAYGTKIADAVHVIPFEDRESAGFVGIAKEMMELGNMISGQNKAQQGQFVKGNKTQSEYEDVQGHSSGRQKKVALLVEQQSFQPIKMILKCNILQYQPEGNLYNYENQETVAVDPMVLRKGIFTYKIVDGETPENKVVNSDVLQVGLQTIAASPLLQSKYDLGSMFSYMMKTQNIDLKPFELQPAQAGQQLQQMQQAGLTPGGPPEVPGEVEPPAAAAQGLAGIRK